ncbi:CHAD domain-containing protein [Nitrososphaera sp.]|uniref:CHAD domain-containing protein n=1 Tax=Nitrososphaera sp. TaxID=1971748 RepID=UPI00307EB2B8
MAGPPSSSSWLFAALEKNLDRVGRRLAAYLRDPADEENVHDMRTSLRRLEATFALLPKKLRQKNEKQIRAYKEFFRANSEVRDCDIIRTRIEAAFIDKGEFERLFAPALDRRRKMASAKALKLAQSIENDVQPVDLGVSSRKKLAIVDGKKKLDRRAEKVVRRLAKKTAGRLPVVLADSDEKEELHRLRKDLKKLRYVLEMAPASQKKAADRILGPGIAGRLKELQDALGAIHDCDITIDYLKKAVRRKAVVELLQQELAKRDQLFEKFAKAFG